MLALLVNTEEKLGVLSNEIASLNMTLEFFLHNLALLEGKHDTNLKIEDVEHHHIDYLKMYRVGKKLREDINSNWMNLLKSFNDYIEVYYNENENEKQIQLMIFTSMRSCVNKKITVFVDELRGLNNKLLQMRQSRNPKYVPTPPFIKRYHNSYIQEFLSKYTNDIIVPTLAKVFGFSNYDIQAILNWELIKDDEIVWQTNFKEIRGEKDELTMFLKENIWALEIPLHTTHLVHEISHFIVYHIFKYNNINNIMNKKFNKIRRNLQDFCLPFDQSPERPETEYLCDLISLIFHKEMYIVSLFLAMYGDTIYSFIKIRYSDDVCEESLFHGDIPKIDPFSWWIRLKVLCELYREMYGISESGWIEFINSLLDDFHNIVKISLPTAFKDTLLPYVVFEKNYSALIIKQLNRLRKTNVFKKLRNKLIKIEDNERDHLGVFKVTVPIKKHIEQYCREMKKPSIKNRHTYRQLICNSFQSIIDAICDTLSASKFKERKDLIKKYAINPFQLED